jgi:carboxyl-terminal processing protease
MKRSWRLAALSLFLLALLAGGLLGPRVLALTDEARDTLRVYTDLVTVAHDRYGGDVTYRDIVYASIQGMLRTLDPHTSFLPPRAYTGMRERQQASFYGLGILVGVRDGQLTVISPIEGTPASRLGMRAGDVISSIEGKPTDKMNLDEAVDKLKGPKGTDVHITIVRRGLAEPLALTVTRDEIPQTTVRLAYMIDPGTGYIQISDFARSTGGEVAQAIASLKGQGMKQLIVDLRNNGGGLLDQAIDMAGQFVPTGSKIVETRGRARDSYQSYRASTDRTMLDLPVVVLVNRGTASASEIVSGAIQDHDVGLVVGTPTWGKGLVQTVYSLSYGAGLALTTAKYYTPSGRLIQRDYTSFYDYYNYDPDTGAAADDGGDGDGGAGTGDGKATAPAPPPGGETFHTDLGRDVYGGGGITPDVHVELAETTPFEQFLLSRSAFFGFAVDFQNRNPVTSRDWQPPADVLDQFAAYLVQEKLTTPEGAADQLKSPEAREFSTREITAEVLNAAFGQQERHRVLAVGDRQIQEALKLFPKAAELLAQRRELDSGAPRQAELPHTTTARR